jgi:Flp pilus assembly protein TadD
VLGRQGKLGEAEAACREAIRLRPTYSQAHCSLGCVLSDQGKTDEAVKAYREAIRLNPEDPEAHHNLGIVLGRQGKLGEAVAAYRQAIRLRPEFPEAHLQLGSALFALGKPDAAERAIRTAIRLRPGYLGAHLNLGDVLKRKGLFPEALEALRRGQELSARNPSMRRLFAQDIKDCERLVQLDRKLPTVRAGKQRPADASEAAQLAELCLLYKRLPATAARLYEVALADRSDLTARAHRYNAACAAALAGCGKGDDADQLKEEEKGRLRQQALAWLQVELAQRTGQLEKGPPAARAAALAVLRHWQQDADLAGVRGGALSKLPAAEGEAWQKLWAAVADALAKSERAAPAKP